MLKIMSLSVIGHFVILFGQIICQMQKGLFQKLEDTQEIFGALVVQTDVRSLLSCAHACTRYSGSTCGDVCSHFHYDDNISTCYYVRQGNSVAEAWSTENRTIYTQITDCDIGWHSLGTYCYYVETTKFIWNDASENCANTGGRLATVHNETVESFLNTLAATSSPGENVWVGGRYNSTLEKWTWESGEPFDYQNWALGQPDLNTGTCVLKLPLWHDRLCERSHVSICEKCKFN
ncbi:lithostathine-2-like [Mya arenaria]|uniref:lithostathine-2-like n=1 Tax=Mya arenaria TaxID=6604 RepID=UPI0022E90487|nr:lithostathine-2-like [Mya arenaria]